MRTTRKGPKLPGERKMVGAVSHLKPRWPKGVSGNPAGRPKGRKDRWSQDFFDDLHKKWNEVGIKVLDDVIAESPETFLRVVASLVPKEDVVEVQQPTSEAALDETIKLVEAEIARRKKVKAALAEACAKAEDDTGEP